MRKLLSIVLLLVLVVTSAFGADRSRRYPMQDSTGNSPQEPTWVDVDSSSSRSVWFTFKNEVANSIIKYTGSLTVVCFFDTASTAGHAATNLDTVDLIVTLLFHNPVTNTIVERSNPVSGDTLHIATDLKWRVGHNDGEYQLSAIVNGRRGIAGVKVTVGTNLKTNPFRFRSDVYISEDS